MMACGMVVGSLWEGWGGGRSYVKVERDDDVYWWIYMAGVSAMVITMVIVIHIWRVAWDGVWHFLWGYCLSLI